VPLNEQPAYQHLCCPDCTPIAQTMAKKVMSLPMGPDLTEQQQKMIVASLKSE
jgi:UDP-2-acetamido-2-deoxy-ribo-hexuluronate aminotransferase